MERLFRLVALLALILMPIGMGVAPASAAAPGAHAAMDMPAGHCSDQTGDQGDSGPMKPASMHCGGTCSALPVLALSPGSEAIEPGAQQQPSPAPTLVGISPAPSRRPPRLG